MIALTESVLNTKQQAILDYIIQQINDQGYPPSVREVGAAVGILSSSTVHGYLKQLEKLGFLSRDPAKPRAMVVTNKASKQKTLYNNQLLTAVHDIKLPVLRLAGLLKVNFDLQAYQALEHVSISDMSFTSDNNYLYYMNDDSMINIGIYPGDHLFVRSQSINNGDIVLACVDQQLVVRTFLKGLHQIRLQPENNFLEALSIPVDQFSLIGRICGSFRQF